MFRRLLPVNTDFFNYFDRHIELTIEGCQELLALTKKSGDFQVHVTRIKEIEHKTDDVTHECIDALHQTFITPMDRSDIHRLIKTLDDIIDAIDGAALRLSLYEIETIRTEAMQYAEILVKATMEIREALKLMRNMKNAEQINKRCINVYQFENDGDAVMRAALVRLFKEEKDPIEVIKWKEVFQILEKSVDRCEDVANIIQGVVIEAS